MSADMDAWATRLCEDFVTMQAQLHGQIRVLRDEKAALQRKLDAMPSTLTELQDRVTFLECEGRIFR